MKKLLIILFFLPFYLFAQNGIGTDYYFCCEHKPCLQIRGEANLREHNCRIHGIGCDGGGGGGTGLGPQSPIQSGLTLALIGLLTGSTFAINGITQEDAGAAGGFFLGSSLSLLFKPKKRSMGADIAIGILTVAAGTYSGVKLVESNSNPTTPPEPDKTALITAGGGVLGAVIGMAWHKKLKNTNWTQSRKKRFMSDMVFTTTGNKVGIIVRL